MAEKARLTKVTRRKFLEGAGATAAVVMARQRNWAYAQSPPKPGPADWSRFGCDLHNTRFNGSEATLGRENVARLKLKWTFEAAGRIQTCPTVIGDTLFFGARDGYLYSLDTASGKLKWKREFGCGTVS